MAPLLGELERRTRSYPNELLGLDPELTREGCGYRAQKSWACIANSLGMARTCYSTSASTIHHFASNASRSQYRETLCDLLYDDLRPRILHESRLTVLCEVCTFLQALVVLEASSTPSSSASAAPSNADGSDSSDVDVDNLTFAEQCPIRTSQNLDSNSPSSGSQRHHNRVGKRLHISHLLKIVLQDA